MIVMPNPASSGTGFLTVSGWLQMMGEEEGWAYMDELHREHRRLHPLRLEALQAGGGRRIRDRHLVRVPAPQD